VPKCDGCLMQDLHVNRCTIFVEPASQFEDGKKCWGRCESLAELLTRLEEMAQYNRSRGNDHSARKLEAEMEFWKEFMEHA
jgi:hypothetical protein